MDRLIATNSVDLAQADTAPATGTPQYATSGNPAGGVPATDFPAYAWNAIQEELMAILTAGGITPDRTALNQTALAIQKMYQGGAALSGVDTGVVNAYAMTLQPAPAALTSGMRVNLQSILVSNTGAATLSVNGGAAIPINGMSGNPLQGGELTSTFDAEFVLASNGSAWVLTSTTIGSLPVGDGKQSHHALALGQFPATVSTSGYQKLPSGLIIQWGTFSATAAGSSQGTLQTITLPIAFPNAGFNAVANSGSALGSVTVGATFPSASQISIAYNNSNTSALSVAGYWIAFGH